MSLFPRVMYSPEDSSGGGKKPTAGADAAAAAQVAAMGMATSIEHQKELLDLLTETEKLQEKARLAKEVGNAALVTALEVEIKTQRESAGISQEQLDLLRTRTEEGKARFKAERILQAEINKQAEDQLKLEEKLGDLRDKLTASFLTQLGSIHNLAAKVSKQTGLVNKFNESLVGSAQTMARFGADAAVSIGALNSGFVGFTHQTEASRTALVSATAELAQFGIEAGTSAQITDVLVGALGQSAEQSIAFQKELVVLGNEIGAAPAQLAADFAAASKDLAKYGDQATKVFMDVAVAAKKMGLETSQVLTMTAKFDTFDGAASSVGKLNAQLGTNLNSMEMMNATEAERMEMLRSNLLETGTAFEDMSKFQKMAAAEAMGVDVSTLGKMMGPEEERTASQKSFDKLLEGTQALGEKFTNLGKQIWAALSPLAGFINDFLLTPLSGLLSWVADSPVLITVLSVLAGIIGTVGAALAVEAAITSALTTAKLLLNLTSSSSVIVTGLSTAATWLMNTALWASVAATWALVWPVLAVIAALALMVAPIVLAIYYWDDLVSIFMEGGIMIDLLAVGLAMLLGPIGWVIAGAALLYKHWDTVVEGMTSMFSGLWDMITAVAGGLYSAFAGPLNAIARLFNSTLGSLSITIPDWVPLIGGQEWGIPKIPFLADGTSDHVGGPAIVGERGPELVNLPKGAEVIPNNKVTAEAQKKTGQQNENNSRPTVVKLMLNERELGSAIMDQFNKKMSTAFSIG